jgi:hypothetical protein
VTATPCRLQINKWRPLNKNRLREFKTISPEAFCRTSARRNSLQSVL